MDQPAVLTATLKAPDAARLKRALRQLDLFPHEVHVANFRMGKETIIFPIFYFTSFFKPAGMFCCQSLGVA